MRKERLHSLTQVMVRVSQSYESMIGREKFNHTTEVLYSKASDHRECIFPLLYHRQYMFKKPPSVDLLPWQRIVYTANSP